MLWFDALWSCCGSLSNRCVTAIGFAFSLKLPAGLRHSSRPCDPRDLPPASFNMACSSAARAFGAALLRGLPFRPARQPACLARGALDAAGPRLVGMLWVGGSAALAAHNMHFLDKDNIIPPAAPVYPLPASPNHYVFFCGHREGEHKEFSNWFDESSLAAGGHWASTGYRVWCAELSFMIEKALFFGAHDTVQRLIDVQPHLDAVVCKERAAQIKALGRTGIQNFDAAAWDAASFPAMARTILAKFSQHPALAGKLLATGDAYIAEAAHYDKIWGIGVRAFDGPAGAGALTRDERGELAWSVPPSLWPEDGNRLGRALMLVRDTLRDRAFLESLLMIM